MSLVAVQYNYSILLGQPIPDAVRKQVYALDTAPQHLCLLPIINTLPHSNSNMALPSIIAAR